MATYNTISSESSIFIKDEYLDNLLIGYMPKGLIYDKIYTTVPTTKNWGRIPKQNAPLQVVSNLMISPTGFPFIKLDYSSTDFYQLKYHGLQVALTDDDIWNLGGTGLAQNKAVTILDMNIKLAREMQLASNLTNASVITQNFSPDKTWDNYDADILADISKAIKVVRSGILSSTGCGFPPTTLILPWNIYNAIRRHPQLVKAWLGAVYDSSNKNAVLNADQLAMIFDVKEVLVPEAQTNTNELGATVTRGDIWGNNIVLAHINRDITPAEAKQSLGYTFVPATPEQGLAEFSYDWTTPGLQPQMGKNVVRGYKYDDKLVDVNCACLLTNVLSA